MNGFISIKRVATALLLCSISTAVLLVVLAAVCNAANVDTSAIRIITFAISVVSVFLWSLISARGAERGGLIHGGTVGILYGVIFLCLSAVCGGGLMLSPHVATMLFAVIFSGILGGVIGINAGR